MPPITGPGTMEQPKPMAGPEPIPNGKGPMGFPSLTPQVAPGTTTSPAGIIGYNAQGGVIPQSRPGFGSNDPTLNSAVDYANMARQSPTPGLERANDAANQFGKLQEARQQLAGVNSPGAAGADYSPSAPVAASNPSFFGR